MSRVRKKKISTIAQSSSAAKKKPKTVDLGWNDDDDEQIDSDDEEGEEEQYRPAKSLDDGGGEDDVEEEEALDAKKIRLARQYLQKLEGSDLDEDSSSSDDDDEDSHGRKRQKEDGDDDDDDNYQRIGQKLQRERLKREGALERAVADKVGASIKSVWQSLPPSSKAAADDATTTTVRHDATEWKDAGHIRLFRGHDLTPTCVALQGSGQLAISGSKDHSVLLWDVERGQRSLTLCPHWKRESKETEMSRTQGEVLAVAASDDGRYAVVGRRDATVSIFDIRAAGKNGPVKVFRGHKGAVTCLGFRTQSLQLFSGSEDRCIRHYNLNEMMYLETLYGHQFGVTGLDCHRQERPISVGRDRTARAWKLAEDTHLIFRGGAKVMSADSINVIKDDWYLTGHEDGHLGLWMTDKKRAVATIDHAHGIGGDVPRGICSIGALKGSDMAITGSYDGYLRLWKAMTGDTLHTRSLEPLGEIPLDGYVNGIAVGPRARFCVVAVGQEPRLGRWNRVAKAKNRFGIVALRTDLTNEDDDPITEEIPTDIVEDEESSNEGNSTDSS